MENKELTIQETYELKKKLEEAIYRNIKQFEVNTGFLVQDICYTSSTNDDDEVDSIELITILNNKFYEDNKK